MTYDESEWVEYLAQEKEICLAYEGNSEYKILIPASQYESLYLDAAYLSDILRKMTGSADGFEVVSDDTFSDGKFISLGDTVFSADIAVDLVRDDGYAVKTEGDDIYIKSSDEGGAATATNGVINGIYGFAEDILGCMFVRDDYDYIPYAPTIYIDETDIVENPDFSWRRMYQYEVSQNGWSKRIRSNGTGEATDFGNDHNNLWGTWCHSVFMYVPPELYFDSHPEYFAYVKGKRRYQY